MIQPVLIIKIDGRDWRLHTHKERFLEMTHAQRMLCVFEMRNTKGENYSSLELDTDQIIEIILKQL